MHTSSIFDYQIHTAQKKDQWKNKSDERKTKTISLQEVVRTDAERIITQDAELNRVLGGGIVLVALY